MAQAAVMDFFAHQEAARRRTGHLVFFFGCAVVLIVLAVYSALRGGARVLADDEDAVWGGPFWDAEWFFWIGGTTLLIIIVGSIYQMLRLSGGGRSVAEFLGGRPVAHDTVDLSERRLLNVVEEMAIASGIPIPGVFVLDRELGINAFAAGFSLRDAVVAVTRGALDRLTRDELQGVIAHEFSHIFNGDMRLNIKLAGVLHGILSLALIGHTLMQAIRFTERRRSKDNDNGDAILFAIAICGLILWVIGYVGVFFANIIKSAVSRQREFLADASAVQFTRNPEGLGGALMKIAGMPEGSRVRNAHAAETGHFFFSNGLDEAVASWMATHPPLRMRIERILQRPMETLARHVPAPPPLPTMPDDTMAAFTAAPADARSRSLQSDDILEDTGAIRPDRVAYAQSMLDRIPESLRLAARDRVTARALMYALLASDDPAVRERQRHAIDQREGSAVRAALAAWESQVRTLPPALRLPLAELGIHALRNLPLDDARVFAETMEWIIAADEEVDLFEFTLFHMTRRHVGAAWDMRPDSPIRYRQIEELREPLTALLSALARWDAADEDAARAAYAEAVRDLGELGAMAARELSGLDAVGSALDILEYAAPAVKRKVMTACIRCVGADGRVSVQEAHLLRAIADAMDIPLPPPLPAAPAA